MTDIDSDAITKAFRGVTARWLGQKISRYLSRLEDNFLRRALSSRDDTQQIALLEQQRRVKAAAIEAHRQFALAAKSKLNDPRPYTPGTHPGLDRLHKHLSQTLANEPTQVDALPLHALSPVSVLACYQRMAKTLRLEQPHLNQALSLFNALVIHELPKLYALLQTSIKRLDDRSLDDWISHTQDQLSQLTLSAEQRALSELRLQRLQHRHTGARGNTDALQLDDKQLIESVTAIFFGQEPTQARKRLPASVLASLSNLQTLCCNVALSERDNFLSPLHPARLVCKQLVEASSMLTLVDESVVQRFETDLRAIVKTLASEPSSANFRAMQNAADKCCHSLKADAALAERQKLRRGAGRDKLAHLRRQVHGLIDTKIGRHTLPPDVENLLYGPLSSVLIYHWSRHGGNSEQIRRNLKLIDDIIWYIQPHSDWQSLRQAKAMAKDIENGLLAGLGRINFSDAAAHAVVAQLHQLRIQACGGAGIS